MTPLQFSKPNIEGSTLASFLASLRTSFSFSERFWPAWQVYRSMINFFFPYWALCAMENGISVYSISSVGRKTWTRWCGSSRRALRKLVAREIHDCALSLAGFVLTTDSASLILAAGLFSCSDFWAPAAGQWPGSQFAWSGTKTGQVDVAISQDHRSRSPAGPYAKRISRALMF